MNPLRSSLDAQNASIPLENTAKHCAFKSEILTAAIKLRERGYSEAYLSTMIRALLEISRNVNLHNPSEVSLYIARKKVKDSYKANLCDFYRHYADYCKIHFIKPKYSRDRKLPYVRTREELNIIISHASKKCALIYSILKDTGIRPVEASNLTPSSVDLERGTLSILTAKHGKPRVVIMKPKEKGNYKCKRCGYILHKKDAIASGYNSESYLHHIHCPKSGEIITHLP